MKYADFENFETLKCFIPRRDVCLQTPKGSICFYLCFIPRRDYESSTEGGPIVFTYVFYLGRKRILDFQNLGW